MFEFHGWAVVKSSSGRRIFDPTGLYEPDDERLFTLLEQKVREIEESTREGVHVQMTVNRFCTLTVNGHRNHSDHAIFELFQWLGMPPTDDPFQ